MLSAFMAGALAVVALRKPSPTAVQSSAPPLVLLSPTAPEAAVPPTVTPPAQATKPIALEPIEVLDEASLRDRSVEIFPSAYATLLSIVQGIALGLLVTQFANTVKGKHGIDRLAVISESVASFSCVVVIYYMYVWFVLIVRWAPTILDTLIPFGLGTAQIGAILSIPKHENWILWIAGVQFAGTIAFLHSFLRSRPDMFSERDFKAIRRLLRTLMISTASGFVLALVLYLFMDEHVDEWFALILSLIVTAIGIALTAISERSLSAMYRRNGLRWLRSGFWEQAVPPVKAVD